MKPLKGVFQETSPIDQPENSLIYGKNGILNKKLGAVTNESGFLVSSATIPYTPNGAIPIDDKVIIFSTDNVNSAIGLYHEDTDTYQAVLDRTDLGFSLDKPITGEVKRNYRGDIICTFTDKTVTAKCINLSTATNSQDLKDLLLFPSSKNPVITLTSVDETGGSIKTGAVYIAAKYSSLDGTESNWSKPFGPVYINSFDISVGSNNYVGVEAGTATTKKIQFRVENIDTEYDKMTVAIISKINGVVTAKTLPEIDILGSVSKDLTYTGAETTEDITLAEILTPTANYRTVGCFTQINGILYGANLSTSDLIKYQKIANNVVINYTTKITKAGQLTDEATKYASQRMNTSPKGFPHGEVMAFYISFHIDGNNRTPAFHIPGRAALIGEKDNSSVGATQGLTAKKFQLEDTTGFIGQDATTGIGRGRMGYWENQTELYPNTDDFNSTVDYLGNSLGGEDLRGTPVRHHKFPTIATCKERHYSTNSNYGITELDVLGIDISNVVIPADIADKVQGWEIYYAKRTTDNTTVAGQSLLHFGSYQRLNYTTYYDRAWTTGGNWNLDDNDKGSTDGSDVMYLTKDYLRFYSFDLLLNKPSVNPSFITQELKLRTTPNFIPDPDQNYWRYSLDYLTGSSSLVDANNRLRRISQYQYVPRDVSVPSTSIFNINTEEFIHAKIEGTGLDLNVPFLVTDIGIGYSDTLPYEESYLSNLNVLRSDVYNSFTEQDLVSTGGIQTDLNQTSLLDVHGGDTYVVEHSYMTFGPRSPVDNNPIHFNRFVRRFVCESVNNAAFRHETTATSSKFFPKTSAADMTLIDATSSINNWAYNKDYTSVNDLHAVDPFNTDDVVTNKFPFRIIRCKANSREDRDSVSWKTFLPNDYFESVQHRGEIINIQGLGNDRLIIHHKNGLYITKTNAKIQTDVVEIVLGSGDIFELPPDEAIPSKHGYLGTQHQLSCLMTPYGYFFVDAELGGVYLYNGSKPKDLTPGLSTFLQENLVITPVNGSIDNPFTGNGISVAWDEEHDRIILGVKNIDGVNDKSFTLSYMPENDGWAMFHSYIPDFLFNTRINTYSFKTQNNSSKIFKHNKGEKGIYYNAIDVNPIPYPFFIDVVFKSPKDAKGKSLTTILQNINWISEVKDNDISIFDETIDHITIWNSYQSSGKIPLTKERSIANVELNNRNPNGTWSFNKFRDLIKNRAIRFTGTIFEDYRPITSNIDNNMSWFNKRRMEDKFFIVRFEYDNVDNKEIFLYEANAESRPSFR